MLFLVLALCSLLAVWQHTSSTTAVESVARQANPMGIPPLTSVRQAEIFALQAPSNRAPTAAAFASARSSRVSAQAQMIQLFVDAPKDVLVGDKFPVAVMADVPEGASNFFFTVYYDPSVLRFVAARQGDFMTQGNAVARLSTEVNASEGMLAFRLEQDGGPPVAGLGGLVTVEFEAVADARAPTRIALGRISMGALEDADIAYETPKAASMAVRR